jgi:predicted RNA-binding Zn-ribbon protein involved in translation (DUF1610 family)
LSPPGGIVFNFEEVETMEKLICGPCAQKVELLLATRINMAKARKLDVEYVCPECGSTHAWTYGRGAEDLPALPPQLPETAQNEEIQPLKETFIQTRLF